VGVTKPPLSIREMLEAYAASLRLALSTSSFRSPPWAAKHPLQAMKDWHKLKPELFKKPPY